ERVRGSIDVPMDADGAKDIEQVAQQFAAKGGISQIVSSNQTRARQTAEILRKHNPDAKVRYTGALQAWHLGGEEGKPQEQALPVLHDLIHNNPNAAPPGKHPLSTAPGESFNTAKGRVLPEVQQAMRDLLRHPNQIIVLSMHRSGV